MSVNGSNQPSTQTRRKRAPVACTECRRRHVRCKVAIREGAPCGRCASMSLTCTYSPTEAANNVATRTQSTNNSPDPLPVHDSPLSSPTERSGYYAFVPGQSPYTTDEVYLVSSSVRGDSLSRSQPSHTVSHTSPWSQSSLTSPHGLPAYPGHRISPPIRSPQEPARPWGTQPSPTSPTHYHHHPSKEYHHLPHTYIEPKFQPHANNASVSHQRQNEGWNAPYGSFGGGGSFSEGFDPYHHVHGRPQGDGGHPVVSSQWPHSS